jgi:hypothetical protein
MKLPFKYTSAINSRALELAKDKAPKKTGAGAAAMLSSPSDGRITIVFPKPRDYMFYQEVGTKSRVMYELIGKTIPIQLPDGTTIFRKATAENVGRRRITSRDAQGRIVSSKLSWWHPGIKPKRFAASSMDQAFREFTASVDSPKALDILKNSDVSEIIKTMFGEN